MSGHIVDLGIHRKTQSVDLHSKLGEVLAVLYAIDAGEFLASSPEGEFDVSQQQTAVILIGLAQRLLSVVYEDLA